MGLTAPGSRISPASTRAAVLAGGVLLLFYIATLAPELTWWDSGEFITAAHTLGIPHPPGSPLFVLVANVFSKLFVWAGPAASVNLLSAFATAGACAVGALLVVRRTGSAPGSAAAALCAGGMATVWINATETEVYALSLLLSALMLWSANRAGESGGIRWFGLTVYLVALAAPLHLTALVAAPAAIYLASRSGEHLPAGTRMVVLAGVSVMSAGAGMGSVALLVTGSIMMLSGIAWWRLPGRLPGRPYWPLSLRLPLGVIVLVPLVVIAFSALAFLLVRARHDPGINQGNPATFDALLSVLSREQYGVAALFPRQAPVWLQLSNYLEYFDWQFALGLAPDVSPAPLRTGITLVFIGLAYAGAIRMRVRSPVLWRALLILFVSASLGVVAYLNLKAGPTIGYGILPEGAPHEVRERDYFFALSFWCFGMVAGFGAWGLMARLGRAWIRSPGRTPTILGVALASLPLALNFGAVNRRVQPEADLPVRFAHALLEPLPRNAVLFVAGDNDSYPLWYLQQVKDVRRDVTVVTSSLIGAAWYRQELYRRHGLGAGGAGGAGRWEGYGNELVKLLSAVKDSGRPVAVAVTLAREERDLFGEEWALAGFHYIRAGDAVGQVTATTARDGPPIHADGIAMSLAWGERDLDARVRTSTDPTSRYLARVLGCAHLARDLADPETAQAAGVLLDSICNFR